MEQPMIATARVLVVEDEEIVSVFIRNELEDAGFELRAGDDCQGSARQAS